MLSLGLQNLLSPMIFSSFSACLPSGRSRTYPIIAATMAVMLGLSVGSTPALITPAASASYIAAMRLALPAANPALALTLFLGVTFPSNLLHRRCKPDRTLSQPKPVAVHADEVVDAVFSAIRGRIGFVTMADVFVLRPERF